MRSKFWFRKKLHEFGRFGLIGLVWSVLLCKFGLVDLVWLVWFGSFGPPQSQDDKGQFLSGAHTWPVATPWYRN